MSESISIIWLLFCIFLVYMMQIGFLLLESGMVRKKNNSSVAFKNLIDFAFGFIIFLLFGFTIYSGDSLGGFSGSFSFIDFSSLGSLGILNFLYIAGFATATCTIVSGAIAERINSTAYVLLVIIISTLCFPFVSHWVWNSGGFLNQAGFIDLAGGSVVHCVGGTAALAAVLILGKRKGVDLKRGIKPSPSNNVEIVFGTFLLILCWMGFNAGAESTPNKNALLIILNTFTAACAGFLSVYFFYTFKREKSKSIPAIANGALAGVVGITACAHLASIQSAILIGSFCGLSGMYAEKIIAKKLDDVVGAISVHLVAGSVGVLVIPFLKAPLNSKLFFESFIIQFLGLFIIIAWTFAIVYFSLKLINRFQRLRINEKEEDSGINYEEFGITDELGDFFREIDEQIECENFSKKISVERFTVVGQIAEKYNQVTSLVCDMFEREKRLKEQVVQASALSATGEMASGLAHEINNPLGIIKLSNISIRKCLKKIEVDHPMINEFMKDIDETIDRISKITVGLRNISRETEGEEESLFLIKDLLDDTTCISSEKCRQNGIGFEIDTDESIKNSKILGNRVQISQAMINLFNNAYHEVLNYSEKWIRIIVSTQDNSIFIRVVDSGSGIKKDVLPKIFNPFFTTKDIGVGTGIGLSISKKMIERSGGELNYELFNGNTSFVIRVKKG